MHRQTRLCAPAFVRIELALHDDGVDLQVWEADDARYLSRQDHCTTYPNCSVDEAVDVVASVIDCLGLPPTRLLG